MSPRALGPMFHWTSEEWATHIVNNGQRANMSPLGNYGPGLYLTSRHEEAHTYASGRNSSSAVVEGHLSDPRVHDLTREDQQQLDDIYVQNAAKKDGSYRRALNSFSAQFRKQGYNLLRNPSTGFHVAIRPNVFMPTKVHYPGETVELR